MNLLRYLDRERFLPIVAFLDEGPFVDEVAQLGVEVIRLPVRPRLRQIYKWRIPIRAIADTIRQTDSDIVQSNGEKVSVFAGLGARAAGRVPCIFWLHDAPGANGLAGWFAQLAMALTPRAAVVTCSAWLRAAFERKLRLRAQAIVNGLDLAALPNRGDGRALKAEMGWPESSLIITHAARLQRWKGTEFFVRAAARLTGSFPELRFLVVGGSLYGRESSYADELRRLAIDCGLGDRLRYTGYRTDAVALMAGSDVIVHCSTSPDPFPTVVLEGMALGKAVVATRTGGAEEALEDGNTGLLVPPGDARSLAEAITCLIPASERHRLGAAARETARKLFSAERMAREFEMLYLRLAG